MTEQQSPYNLTVPVYPVIATITNGAAPCASCGGVVTPDPESPDLERCACGLRRMRPTAKPAAATGIKPCPFCGCAGNDVAADLDGKTFVVACFACDIEGPWRRTRQDAIDAWNTRAAATPRDDAAVREALAAYAHEAWSGWMRYLFSTCDGDRDNGMRIPAWAVERWVRQVNTSYADLPEDEQASDRVEADKILALIGGAS